MNHSSAITRRRATTFVFVTVVLDAMGIGIIIPIMPDLLEELSGLSVGQAAIWGGYLTFSYALMQFLFSPTIGSLSDRFGRRPVLLISLFALGVDYVIMALAPTLWVLFVGRVLAGIAGATYSTANAVIADITPKEGRAAAFGLVGAGFGVGFILGPALGGLMGELGTRAPFLAAAAVAFANFAYGWFVMPESLSPEKRRSFDWRRANPFGAFAQVTKVPAVAWFVAVSFLFSLAHHVYPSMWSFYTKEKFAWEAWEIGLSLAVVGICMAVVQGWLIKYIVKWLGEVRTVILGTGAEIIALLGIAIATKGWMIYALMPAAALGNIVSPALTALMANRISDDAQGELQGVISSAQSITVVLSPIMMTQLFGAFTAPGAPYLPGAPFYAAGVLMALCLVPFFIGLRKR